MDKNELARRRFIRQFLYSLTLSAFLSGVAEGAFRKGGLPAQSMPGVRTSPISVPAILPSALPSAPKLPEGTVPNAPKAENATPQVPQAIQPGAQAQAPEALSPAAQLDAAAPQARNAQDPQSQQASDARRLDKVFDGVEAPKTRRDETIVDDYHGTKVADPYRWLEDDNSEETKAWVKAQNAVTESVLAKLPERQAIVDELKKKWNYERFSAPTKIGGWWVYYHNTGLQNQSVLYKSRTLYGKPEVLLDPNALSTDGTVALSGISFSDDGKYMAYAVSKAGSDWVEWRVKGVNTGTDLDDHLKWTKFTGATWDKDGKGFYYSRYPEPKAGDEMTGANVDSKVYYHKLGTPQSEDALIYEEPENPERSFAASRSEDGRFLFMYQYEGTESKNRVYVKDLSKPGTPFLPLFTNFDASYSIIGNKGDTFYVQTTHKAPRGKLVEVSLSKPHPKHWHTIIAQPRGKDVLESVVMAGDRFVANWMIDVKSVLRVYGPKGGLRYEVKLPAAGAASNWSERSRGEKTQGFISFTSFNYPNTNFRMNLKTGKLRRYRAPKIADFDPKKYEVKQVFYPSKDGTKIPMFIVHKKGLKLDGNNPTLLYGYGGFSVNMQPWFSMARTAWLERGGVWAMPNLRGGAEYGEQWHEAGRLHKKQNVFDDFIAAGEYLIKEGYARANQENNPGTLAVNGGSNGGLLVGAVMTQRPDLFTAAVPEVGVLDMLRYHLFTVGKGWAPEYGTSDDKAFFETLFKYSPLHNIKPGTKYPATMVMTGDHDDRVVPAHSHKFTAALQAAQAKDGPPILTRIEENAGHGAGKPLAKVLQEVADMWAFLLQALRGGSSGAPKS